MSSDAADQIKHVALRVLGRKLDAALAPLVAEGGVLEHQSMPSCGIDRYYVDGRLRLELGPPKLLCWGSRREFFRPMKVYRIPTNDQIVPTDVPTGGVVDV